MTKLKSIARATLSELRKLRGEVITALGIGAAIAVITNDTAAVVIGLVAVALVTGISLALSSRARRKSPTTAPPNTESEPSPEGMLPGEGMQLARARLLEVASKLDLAVPEDERPSLPKEFSPLVSVVVPCFNDERFVEAAIDSLRQQSYSNWECIIVDDSSTDRSWEIALGSVGGDARFHTIRLESNSGSGAARNRGIREASGEYLAFLDADDLLLRESLNDRVAAIARHLGDPVIAGSFCAVRSSPEGVTLESLDDRRHATQASFVDFVVADGECPFTLHAPLADIERIRAVGGFDETMTTGAVDWDLWYRLLRNGHVFVPSRTLGAVYRQKQGGITRGNKAGHTEAGARLVRAAFAPADPAVLVAPTSYPMPRPLGEYRAALVVADRAVRFAAMALAEEDTGGMHKILSVLDRGTWPLLERHLDWEGVVGRGIARVVGLRPRDMGELDVELRPFVATLRAAVAEASA